MIEKTFQEKRPFKRRNIVFFPNAEAKLLEWCLAHNKFSINIYSVNKQMEKSIPATVVCIP